VEHLSDEVTALFQDQKRAHFLAQRFTELHESLCHGGSEAAAQALSDLLESPRV